MSLYNVTWIAVVSLQCKLDLVEPFDPSDPSTIVQHNNNNNLIIVIQVSSNWVSGDNGVTVDPGPQWRQVDDVINGQRASTARPARPSPVHRHHQRQLRGGDCVEESPQSAESLVECVRTVAGHARPAV